MDTVKIDSRGTRLIAHRGLSGLETENTLCAFVAAGNRACYYGIETDVRTTKDGKYVVSHDDSLLRVFGCDRKISELTFGEVRNVRKTKDGEREESVAVPTLKEYFDVCNRYGKVSVTELKIEFSDEQLKEIVALAKESGQEENVVFISFLIGNLIRLRRLFPSVRLQLLTGEINDQVVKDCVGYRLGVDVCYSALDGETVGKLKSNGIGINCWTVDDPSDAERLIGLGVDYITTDVLEG